MAEQLVPIQFGFRLGQTFRGQASNERVLNMYTEANPANAKSPVSLLSVPGTRRIATTSGSVRAVHPLTKDGTIIYIIGSDVYASNGPDDGSPVTIASGVINPGNHIYTGGNGTHAWFGVQGGGLYAVNRSGITSLPEANVNGITYQDGYLIATQANSQKLWISGLDDATTINATDFTSADALTGNVMGCISDHREVFVFTQQACEVFQNTGQSDFPFQRASLFERGCGAPATISKALNAVFWLGDDGKAYMAQGYNPQVISPPWVETLFPGRNDPPLVDTAGFEDNPTVSFDQAKGFTYTQYGHTFWVLDFGDATLVYDITTGVWHERQNYVFKNWAYRNYFTHKNRHIVTPITSAATQNETLANGFYELWNGAYEDSANISGSPEVLREVISPPIFQGGNRILMHELFIDVETGVGIGVGGKSDPHAVLDYTDDRGATWIGRRTAPVGKTGERWQRLRFNRLGMFRERSYRLRFTEGVPWSIHGAYARMELVAS